MYTISWRFLYIPWKLEYLAVPRGRIIGPIFFQNTINAQRYSQQLLEPFLEEVHPDEFEGTWPVRSLDLTPLNFSICRFVKDQVYKEQINNLEELINRITLLCDEIRLDTLQHIYI